MGRLGRTMGSVPQAALAVVGSQQTAQLKKSAAVTPTRGVSRLMYACQQGDVDKVRKILRQQPYFLMQRDRTGKSPLHYCSTSDYVGAAQAADLLVMAAPDLVEGHDDEGFTPLHLAVIAGNMPLVTFLLANKADINAVDSERHTVVHWATVCGETEALRAVLSAGAPVSTPDIHGGYPLHYAAQMCGGEKDSMLGLQVLHTLLSHPDVVVSVEDGDRRQPLLWAASAGSAKAVLALVRAGASVEAPDRDGLTALHCAASRGHTDCIDTLLTLCGASPDVIDTNGCTALHYAVTLGHADATALLLNHGANPNRQDRKGRSPAHCGCAKGQLETLKLLAAHEANLWLRNARGDLPLHEAAASGRRELVRWLLESRPSQVNARNNDGRCPLHLAALNDNADMCKILLDAGAQVNPVLRTSKNVFMTPLDCALQRGFRSTAKYLQLHGGLPANRIGSSQQTETAGSSANLNIREDVSFWGGSTSDSERENAENKNFERRKRAYRRKLTYKYEKRKGNQVKTSEEKPEDEKSKVERTKKTKISQEDDILTYSSEVMVKDKVNGIKIEHNGEVTVKGKTKASSKIPVAAEAQTKTIEKERRPKSAKRVKPQKKIEAKRTDKAEESTPIKLTKKDSEDKVLQTEQILEKIVPKIDQLSPSRADEKAKGDGSQSERSAFTSVDEGDEQTSTVVEAQVHSPPRTEDSEVAASESKPDDQLETSHATQQSETKEVGKSELLEEVAEKTDANVEKQEEKVADLEKEASDAVLPKDSVEKTTEVIEGTLDVAKGSDLDKEQVPQETAGSLVKEIQGEQRDSTAEAVDDKTSPAVEDTLKTEKSITEDTATADKEEADQSQITLSEEAQQPDTTTELKEKENSRSTETEKMSGEATKQKKKFTKSKAVTDDKGRSPETTPQSKSSENDTTTSTSTSKKDHKSFRVLDEDELDEPKTKGKTQKRKSKPKSGVKKQRSRSEEITKADRGVAPVFKAKRSKIPTPTLDLHSKSDKHLEKQERKTISGLDTRIPVPSSSMEHGAEGTRSESNMSAPLRQYAYSDEERDTDSDDDGAVSSATRKKRLKKRARTRGAKSAGSDYESSNLIDSGFEPSPRSSRLPKCRNISDRGVNMTSVTQTIQSNIRRYHLERKIFQHLLELKRLQIRAGQHNEAILVKRAIDAYHRSCAATVGAGRYIPEDYTFKSFEKFLYQSLRKIQKNGAENLKDLPLMSENPLLCTQSTNRCMHATHAYTGIPCAAYLPKMDHHTIPKIGFNDCKPSGFLPHIHAKKSQGVTLELCHGNDKQIISLPADKLDKNKRYYVTFTVKGQETGSPTSEEEDSGRDGGHRHSKSD